MQSTTNDNVPQQHDYSIEKLSETFADHADLADQHQQFVNTMYAEQNPDQELPQHMGNPFNAAKAFSVMANEIAQLKKWIRDHMQYEHPFV